VHRKLRRPDATLSLLWKEYRAGAPDGFSYSRFCNLYRAWMGRLKPALREVHPVEGRIFAGFAGSTMAVLEGVSGEERRAEIFAAVLGASSYSFACAAWSQGPEDWTDCHRRAFEHFGGVARQLVSDNLRAGISHACFHEPAVNRAYARMAAHYGTAVLPAPLHKLHKLRDGAKVGVQVVQRWIMARLRNQRFFSLDELNAAVQALVARLNERPMRALGTTPRALFEEFDRPALLPLPEIAYEHTAWQLCRVGLDRHVEVEQHFYPVPHSLARQEVEARITTELVEIFHRGQRVASHVRSSRRDQPTTLAEHMPRSNQRCQGWSHERLHREADVVGHDAAALVEAILRSRPYPERAGRSCTNILGLVKRHGAERVDTACARALALETRACSSVATIFNKRQELRVAPDEPALLMHGDIRGPGYYH
jgi:transposase